MNYVVPVVIVAIIVYALVKKVDVYTAFIEGVKSALTLAFNIFPYLSAVLLLTTAMQQSRLIDIIADILSPLFNVIGLPTELTELIIIRPFSGSGSLAVLNDIFNKYGTDSYIGRCASVIMGSSETVFYVSAVYFANTKVKKFGSAIAIALFCSALGVVLSCLLCRVM